MNLEPERAVTIERGSMKATARDPWLRLDLEEGFAGDRWIRIRYTSSYFDDPVRPLIRFATSNGHEYIQVMNGPVAGCAEWIGYVPKGTDAVFISPVREIGQFQFRVEKVENVSRAFLVKRGIKYDKRSLMQAIGAKVINAEEEHWDTLRFAATATPLKKYDSWYRANFRPLDLLGLDRPRSDWTKAPAVHLLLELQGTPARVERTIASLKAQAFENWSLTAIVSPTTSEELESLIRREMEADRRFHLATQDVSCAQVSRAWHGADLVGLIDAGDSLPDYAAAVVVEALARRPQARLIYGDEDACTERGMLHSPLFKPNWSPSFYKSGRYLGRLTLVRNDDFAQLRLGHVGELFVHEGGILDRLVHAMKPAAIHHIRRVLYRRLGPLHVHEAVRKPVVAVSVSPEFREPEPKVSIIIPTRDRADLLDQCLTSIYRKTRYQSFEIILVDNGTKTVDAKALLRRCRERPDHTVIERPGPFNYSSLCNDGAARASGEVLVFLNNDIIVYQENWLRHLVWCASQADVGAAGAKLLFPDRSIEHAGVVIGHGGLAGHIHHREPGFSEGYMGQLVLPREVSATTGACLAINKKKFESVGGFDAENLPIDLNDIDLCLKLGERGWRIVWTPEAVMYHLQSASRGFPVRPSRTYRKERTYFRKRWMHVIRDDPYFHPALSLFSHKLALA